MGKYGVGGWMQLPYFAQDRYNIFSLLGPGRFILASLYSFLYAACAFTRIEASWTEASHRCYCFPFRVSLFNRRRSSQHPNFSVLPIWSISFYICPVMTAFT